MLITLPTSRLLQTSEVASWMLFPEKSATTYRKLFRASVRKSRYLVAYADTTKEKQPHPYIWVNSNTDELTLIPTPFANGDSVATSIDGGDGGTLLSVVSEMMALDTSIVQNASALAFRKGFTAGTILLACYFFDSNRAPGHKSSKARGTIAAGHITGLKERSIENFFLEYHSVAHLWAAYQLSASQRFFDVKNSGILQYTNSPIANDFLDDVDLERLLSIADQLADYGQNKKTGKTTLLARAELIRFVPKAPVLHPIYSTPAMIEVFLKSYPPGKRDTRA
jgi:hypothetical protein